jgi:hypothetical protein
MKKLGYFTALVSLSLASVTFITTITAVTLASYAKAEKSSSMVKAISTETAKR